MPKLFSHSFRFNPFAVEGTGTSDAKGVASGVGQDEADPDWRPM
jgi:hypothetical protein